jgi:hypothetical protein
MMVIDGCESEGLSWDLEKSRTVGSGGQARTRNTAEKVTRLVTCVLTQTRAQTHANLYYKKL